MVERIGIIDLGTNTFNLLIVDKFDKSFESIYAERMGVGLGLGGINKNQLAEESVLRALETLKKYKSICDEYKTNKIIAFGTSAIRNARNNQEFVKRVLKDTGISVEIIDGNQEAEYIYQGVKLGYDFENLSLIMDIGGGSTEFILADKNGVKQKKSFEIGVSRIFQINNFSYPLSKDAIAIIEAYLEKNTENYFNDLQTDILVGSSGSFESFYEWTHEANYPQNEFLSIPIENLIQTLKEIMFSSKEKLEKNPFIIPIRKKMIPIAAVKTLWVINKTKPKKLIISPYSLKEGVIFIK